MPRVPLSRNPKALVVQATKNVNFLRVHFLRVRGVCYLESVLKEAYSCLYNISAVTK